MESNHSSSNENLDEDYLDYELPIAKGDRLRTAAKRKQNKTIHELYQQKKCNTLKWFKRNFEKFRKQTIDGYIQQELLNERYDLNLNTLLHYAAKQNNREKVDFLIENNADPCVVNKQGVTAYDCLTDNSIRKMLQNVAQEKNYTKQKCNDAHIPTREELEVIEDRRKWEEQQDKLKAILPINRQHKYPHMIFFFMPDSKKCLYPAYKHFAPTMSRSRKEDPCAVCNVMILLNGSTAGLSYLGTTVCSLDCLKTYREKLERPLTLET